MPGKKIFAFVGLALVGFFAYRNCFGILIPADDYGLFYLFKNGIILGFDNKELASPPYLISFPLLFGLYQLIGMNAGAWIFTAVLLHVLNAFLVFLLCERMIRAFFPQSRGIAFFASFIFLLSPYQTEAVLWAPTDLTILLATAFFLLALWQLLHFFETTRKGTLALSHCFFLMAVFSYEVSFVLPGIAMIFYLLYRSVTGLSNRGFIIGVMLPQTGILILYAAITRLIFGEWIWHAGSMDLPVSFPELGMALVKYLAKFFLLYRYVPQGLAGNLNAIFGLQHSIIVILFLVLGALLIWIAAIRKNKSQTGKLLLAMFLCFLIALLPVLPLDTSFLRYIYTDRYGYLPSVFFYIFLCAGVILLFRKFSVPVLTGYSVLCLIFLVQTIGVWTSVNDRCNHLIKDYARFLKYDKVFVLDVPAYQNGLAAFRTAFDETMYMTYNTPHGRNTVVSGSYHEAPSDTLLSADITNNLVLVMGPAGKKNYFSTNCGWAESYETDEFKVGFDQSGSSYSLIFKNEIPSKAIFIYAAGNKWRTAGKKEIAFQNITELSNN